MEPSHRRRQAGLTVIELVVVVAIVALLAAIVIAKIPGIMNSARSTPGSVNMIVITAALERYYVDTRAYPTGSSAAQVMAKLKGGYLKPSTAYRNGFDQGFLYLLDQSDKGYWLIDLQGEKQDDDASTTGQQIIVRCSNGVPATDVERVFTVLTGSAATLTLPTAPSGGGSWRVPTTMWSYCALKNPNPAIQIVTKWN